MIQRKDFPTGFLFGSASSAYQYEGAAKEGGKGPNICDTFAERYPERIQDRSTGFNAADSYHRYKDDVQLMKKMGFTAYRFSFAWSRILPGGKLSAGVNREGIEYYNNLINELVANDIEPFVTLFHWDVPQALEDEYGGFLSPNIILDFCDYAELCFWEFGDRVKNWITLNEPWSFCVGGYVEGNLPPGRGTIPKPAAKVRMYAPMETKSISLYSGNQYANQHQIVNYPYGRYSGWDDNIYPMISTLSFDDRMFSTLSSDDRMFSTRSSNNPVISTISYDGPTDDAKKYGDPGVEPYKVAHNQLLAHAAAVHLYKDNYQGSQQGKIGISLVSEWMVPLDDTSAVDKACKERALDFMLGWFLGPITCGKYPKTMIDNVGGRLPNEKELEVVKGTYDFIGVNYYTAAYATMPDKDETGEKKPDTYRTDRNVKLPREKNGKFIGKRGASVWLFSYPEGIRMLLSYIKKNYCDPIIYITENGFDTFTNVELSKACADDDRMEYYQDHLKSIQKAITDDKVKVKGYFAWSLLDNYEWNMGYTSGFGLMHVDIKNGFTRYPKQSAIWFQKFLCA